MREHPQEADMRTSLSLTASLLTAIFTVTALAQSTAVVQITGAVTDAAGASVPAAAIRATQVETGFTRNAETSPDGSYILSNLPIGPYKLEVSAKGFKSYLQQGIILQVNTNPVVNVVLQV